MKGNFRCTCPITSALDILGDKWTLVIIKQMLIEDMETFKDFAESEEAIATNILSARLKMLEEYGLITKGKLPNNKKTNIYRLTEKGLSLAPIIVELALWSDEYVRPHHPEMRKESALELMKTDKEGAIKYIHEAYSTKSNQKN